MCLLLPTYFACFNLPTVVAKHNVETFKQLSSSRDLMSAWQGGGLHSQVPQMSEHSPDGKAKVRGTKEGPSCVSLQKIRGYDKSQHLSWGKVQLKKSPRCLHPLSYRVEQCGFHAGWNSGWPISATGRLNLYCWRAPRGERMGGTKVIA